jgi:hypothetical protein
MGAGRILVAERRDSRARKAGEAGQGQYVIGVVGEVDARHTVADVAADVEAVPARAAGRRNHGARAAQELRHVGRIRLRRRQHRNSANQPTHAHGSFPVNAKIRPRSSGINLNVALAPLT